MAFAPSTTVAPLATLAEHGTRPSSSRYHHVERRTGTARLASGLEYLAEYGTAHYGYLALLGLWVLAFKADRRFLLLAPLTTVWAGYVASVGGDWIPHARFLVPLVPMASVATATALVLHDELSRRLNGQTQARSWPLLTVYPQDHALFQAPGFSEEYEYLCSIPSEPSPAGWVWHYNVFARKGLALAQRPRPDAEGSLRCF